MGGPVMLLRENMTANTVIERASLHDAREIAVMVGELLSEIRSAIGVDAFKFHLEETTARLGEALGSGKYFVFVARHRGGLAGFVTLYESFALYAEGAFGTIAEFYVRPAYRSTGIGRRLVAEARSFGVSRGWRRLEVTTPALPQFEKTLAFYEREGFEITGGRKLKVTL